MSLAPLSAPERQPSPRLTVNLGSNNPFRNRTVSPSSPVSPAFSGRRERPLSTNPFLDDTEFQSGGMSVSPEKPALMGNTAELFANLSLDPPSQQNGRKPAPPRPENKPPKVSSSSRGPPPAQRPPRERPERQNSDPFDIFADPPASSKAASRSRSRDVRRPRRNSESSIMDRPPKPLDPEDERRRRERRHREREARHKDKDGKSRSSRRPGVKLDVIDKLDVTSIYGTGLFHHDGPFDACNPHRNRKGHRNAPMQAFPKDSKNMQLGGAGPNNSNIDLDMFHGVTTESYNDFAGTGYDDSYRKNDHSEGFNSTVRVEPVHGAESMGLGTSTFLEGAPASRAAIERRQSENESMGQNGGLQRKKSLAQKLRGINRSGGSRVISPEPMYVSPSTSGQAQKVNEKNPFFQDYDDEWDKKGAKIQLAEESRSSLGSAGRSRSASSPRRENGLERNLSNDRPYGSGGNDEMRAGGGGFMTRMKSLRKPRPERRPTTDS